MANQLTMLSVGLQARQDMTETSTMLLQDSDTDHGATEDDDTLREDVESGLEEVGARMRCLAFLHADIGSRLSSRLQAIGCSEEADSISALEAFSQSLAEVGMPLFLKFPYPAALEMGFETTCLEIQICICSSGCRRQT